VILDLAIHDFDVLLGLLGDVPKRCFAFGEENNVSVSLLYRDFHALVEVSWRVSYSQRRILVVGTEASLLGDFREQKLLLFRKEKNSWVDVGNPRRDQLEEELGRFLSMVEGEDSRVVSGEEGLLSLAVAESARTSLSSGLPVEVSIPQL
jgi:predicted dehydrogenase